MDLLVQKRSDPATLLPAPDQVGSEPIESPWSLPGGPAQVRGGADVDEFSDGMATDAELFSYRRDPQAFTAEVVDLGVPALIPDLDSGLAKGV